MRNAEIVVVNGPSAGQRFALTAGQPFDMGRSPSSTLPLAGPDAAWRHAVISHEAGAWWLVDAATPAGTLVNGARISRRRLEPGDRIRIGSSVLLFREATGAWALSSVKEVLLHACVLGFLFRNLAEAAGLPHEGDLERQIATMIRDLLPCEACWIVSGSDARAPRFADLAAHQALLARIAAVGPQAEPGSRMAGVPVLAQGAWAGAILARLAPGQADDASEAIQVLTSISTLAGMALENTREVASLRASKELLEERLALDTDILGSSAPVRRLLELVERVAPRESTVLILGESGTGKELVARTLHRNSPRRDGPLVAINCAALTETLLESELFGHEKGAFTGATAQKKGKLEMAAGGTVFLDEIAEMPAGLQAKLLRVLEQREFERVGGTETRRLDIRLVAATNRDLATDVRAGHFREDLYHRLNVITLRTPPLRDRTEDVLPLAYHFLETASRECGRVVEAISPEAERALLAYSWPGNVRELENAIERAVVLGSADRLLPEDLPETVLECAAGPSLGAYQSKVTDAKRDSILRAYDQAGGDYKAAAKLLGLHPNYLLRLVRNLGLRDAIRGR